LLIKSKGLVPSFSGKNADLHAVKISYIKTSLSSTLMVSREILSWFKTTWYWG